MHLNASPAAFGRALLLVGALFAAACSTDSTAPAGDGPELGRGGAQGPDFRAANAAKDKHVEGLMEQDGVEGVGVTLTARGEPAVAIFTTHGAVGGLPRALDGVPVELMITGKIEAILPRAKPGGGGANPRDEFAFPVPIGVSIGNASECAAGTLGARVTRGGAQYVLSNNHVLARQNAASPGEDILQPGRYDTACNATGSVIADLSDFVEIRFGNQNNTVDAAIAQIRAGAVGNGTHGGGYGVPDSDPVVATIGMSVQKCGRTTNCNTGTVSSINATVNVQYSGGVARFVNQVVISGNRGAFSRSGDSGSLIVTNNAAANPVALLFAGSNTVTIGNRIQDVLQALSITIDGN